MSAVDPPYAEPVEPDSDPDSEPADLPAKPGLREAADAFRYPEFLRFWVGALISNSGVWMQRVTVPFVLFQLTESASLVGLAGFLQFLPAAAMGPLGGSLADRYPRRTMLLVTQSAMAVVAFVLWATWAAGVRSVPLILVLVMAQGFFGGLNIPSWQALVSELVPRRVLLNAVTLNSAQFNASRALGPAIGGLVIAQWGPDIAFLLNGISYVTVIAALVSISPRPAAHVVSVRPKIMREFADTYRYVRRHPGIEVCVYAVMAIAFFGGPLFAMLVVFKDEVFHISDAAYGIMGAALGTGSVLATPLIAGRGRRLPRSSLTSLALVSYGAAVLAFALSPTYEIGVAVLLVAGGSYLAITSTLNTTVQLLVDEHMRGKVLALYIMGLTVTMPVGSLAQGWLVDLVGARIVVACAGALLLAVTGWLRWGSGRIFRMDDEPAEAMT